MEAPSVLISPGTGMRMTVLLDSYCWFEYFFGSPTGKKLLEVLDSGEEIAVSSINVFEVYRKYLKENPSQAMEKRRFIATRAKVVAAGEEIASLAAEVSAKHGLHATDALIYATAVMLGCTLLTGDPHFNKLPKVKML